MIYNIVNDKIRYNNEDLFKAFKIQIDNLVSKHRQSANSNSVINQISSADELEKFSNLLQKGIITQEEFDLKKKQILGL